MVDCSIRKLVCYGLETGHITKRDEIFATNRIMEILSVDSMECEEDFCQIDLEETLKELLDYAVE